MTIRIHTGRNPQRRRFVRIHAAGNCMQLRTAQSRKTLHWKQFGWSGFIFLMLIGCNPSSTFSQQTTAFLANNAELPDAPDREVSMNSSRSGTSANMSLASISGTVLDTNGSVISGAKVFLSGATERVLLSGENGEFSFSGLPSGSFKLTVSKPGMETVTSNILLLADDMQFLPKIVLPVAAENASIRVVADREELAQEQVQIALDQRVLGVLPNFYSSYDWNAPPMGAKQKFKLALRSVTDPVAFAEAGALAGVEQAKNSFPGYGQGAQGYAKRYGAAYANDFDGKMIGSALLPSLLHQDPRYFYKGTGSTGSRAWYAVSRAVICRGDNGRSQPNYSEVFGSLVAGGVSNLYYPSGSRGASLVMLNGVIEIAGRAGNNLLREFVLRGFTTKVPDYENGKP